MSKKQKVKNVKPKEKEQKQTEPNANKNAPVELPNVEDDSFNFGGLPERSLKKNLGCG